MAMASYPDVSDVEGSEHCYLNSNFWQTKSAFVFKPEVGVA